MASGKAEVVPLNVDFDDDRQPGGQQQTSAWKIPILSLFGLILLIGAPCAFVGRSHGTVAGSHDFLERSLTDVSQGPPVDCGLSSSSQAMTLLTSSALSGTNLKKAFRDMVLKLPNSAWRDGGNAAAAAKNTGGAKTRTRRHRRMGSSAKAAAAKKNEADLKVDADFHEPDLYGGLNVLIIEDASFLKQAMWDSSNPNFGQAVGINYQKADFSTSTELVKNATNGYKGMDGGWGCDYAASTCGGLGGLGFDADAMTHISIFDLCATDSQKAAAFKLQSQGAAVEVGAAGNLTGCAPVFESLLKKADVVAAQGGNPDWVGFVFKKFAPSLSKKIVNRVNKGSLIYLGRSAGAMVAGSDFALTYEPTPLILDKLLKGDTHGLALAGKCAIRPHFSPKWDLPSAIYENVTDINVLIVPNGEGLVCLKGKCRMVGANSTEGASKFESGDTADVHIGRLVDVFDNAFDSYAPQRPVLVNVSKSSSPDCRMGNASKSLVILSSSALANAPLKELFRQMVLKLPDSAWTYSGSSAKATAAAKKNVTDFHEPTLYGGLNVLTIEDASFLKNAMWDSSNPNFGQDVGINYQKAGFSTSTELVKNATNGYKGMDGGWGCDYAASTCGGLGGLGFDANATTHVSIFDLCATDSQKAAAFRLQSQGTAGAVGAAGNLTGCAPVFEALLEKADVVAVQGGNPDWVGFVFKKFAPSLSQKIVDRVNDGSLIYLGRSAGAMVGSSDFALTYEPNPDLLEGLLDMNTTGLGLAGICAIRPHYGDDGLWDIASSLYEDAKGKGNIDVVRVPNGEALGCMQGQCQMYGVKAAEPKATMDVADEGDVHAGRLDEVFDTAFDKFEPKTA